jgi:hypothetical protein
MRRLFALLAVFFGVGFAHAQEPTFLRLQSEKNVPQALQTATITYTKGDVSVDLVAAIHIGDRAYYKSLNKQFEQYEPLLYELVAKPGVVPEKGKSNMTAAVVKIMFDLDHQLERINYKKANFVHADLSLDEMKKVWAKRNEDGAVVTLRLLADLLQKQNETSKKLKDNPLEGIGIGLDLYNADGPLGYKRAFAKTMCSQLAEGQMPTMNQILIKDRNKRCMEVLAEQLKAGKKKIGIFYGAAHMGDFDTRLTKLGFKRGEPVWLIAWDLTEE